MTESGTNANVTVAEQIKQGLNKIDPCFDGHDISCAHLRVYFAPDGSYLTLTFHDDSVLRIERQSRSKGLAARVAESVPPGQFPGPWEDV